MRDLTREVKREAGRLGFGLVGIADPSPSAHARRYRDWLARDYHADMGYLARPDAIQKRADPRILMPSVRSIVVVGMNYYPGSFPPTTEREGRVSRYAWGSDYHHVMMEKLERLAGWVTDQVDRPVAHRSYVDFGPLMERELAQRAGLGWLGKNTNLIHAALGSYVFLGELLLDIELEPDRPFAGDRCGSCTACLDACPTGALVAPRTLDARRCISYLTIEHRDAIPEALRPPMGDWVFGCDICQEVCPWNKRFARPARSAVLDPARPTLDLIELLMLDESRFQARFRNTPLWRPRRAGLLRNAAVVLGNLGAPAAIPALEQARDSDNPLLVEHAAWALEQIRAS
jgi:epoxyqueuosine reductase